MNKLNYFFLLFFVSIFSFSQNQNKQQKFIENIYKPVLKEGKSYIWLDHLSVTGYLQH